MQKKLIGIALIALLSASILTLGHALDIKEKITIVSYYIPLLVEDEENGAFVKLLQEAAARSGIDYSLTLYPTKRAMRLFEDNKVMGIMPALLPTLAKDAALTEQIFSKQIHGFVRRGDTVPATVAELEGKRIGLVRGFSYPRSILYNEKIVVDYADTTDSSLKKLADERIDVAVVDGHTAKRAILRLDIQGLKYDLSRILHSQPAFMAFQPTAEGKRIARQLSAAIVSMKEDGTFDAIIPDITATAEPVQ